MDINAAPSDANSATSNALKEYIGLEKPEYALLIDAPWGAGKTYFVKRECNLSSEAAEIRYVSLNGVADVVGFRRALLKDGLATGITNTLEAVGETVAKLLKLGDLGSMARDVVEDTLINNLPNTIIFDDLERATIDPQELFGLINDFVEHKRKRVIILVNSEAHELKDKFLKHKEKFIGRTLNLQPDFVNAFSYFKFKMPDGKGKDYFESHENNVQEVFEEAGHKNLRLLRNAIRDCALILDRLDEELFAAKEPMNRFVKTYLALAMALAKGEIQTHDLEERASWKFALSKEGDGEDKLDALMNIYQRHKGADISSEGGVVFPTKLHELLFIEGYVETKQLNSLLKNTGQFVVQDENPLWLQMVYWPDCSKDNLEKLVEKAQAYLLEDEPVQPGPYLHIAGNLLHIQKLGGLKSTTDQLMKKILERISELKSCEQISEAKFGTNFGWSHEGGRFSFGGYARDISEDFFEITKAMSQAQLEIYGAKVPDIVNDLVHKFENDLEKFETAFFGDRDTSAFSQTAVLHHLDIGRVAKATLHYLLSGKIREIENVFERFKIRVQILNIWKEEQSWFKELKEKLEILAANDSTLSAAQMKFFLKRCGQLFTAIDE